MNKNKGMKNQYVLPEDEVMDIKLAREMTKLNFEKACADIYSQIVAEIAHNARMGLSVCVVNNIGIDDNIKAWLDEKLRGKGFEVEWDLEDDFSISTKCSVQWYEE